MSGNTEPMPVGTPPGVPASMITPTGNVPAIGVPNTQDYSRLVFSAPYFTTVAIAEIIQPSVTEAVENALPSLIPPYVDNAVLAGIQQYAVLLSGSTMSGPLFLNPLMPTADAQAATKAYVDTMLATAGIPEVPPVPVGQVWARETGQWVPISQAEGAFLPLSGGTMQGNINMSGNTLTNMAAVPAMPNGAAPAQWVLNQIASVSLYQGTWNADTNTPDLTQLSTHVNAYTWIAITTSPSGVVIGAAIPGLQGMTVFNGDTIIYSTVAGAFSSIHSGGITLPEADGRYVQLAGSQMSGALLLNADATQNMQAVTFQQLEAAVANTVTPDAPADGQAYARVGVGTNRWVPAMPLAGGIFTGAVTLAGPGAAGNNPVTVTQLNSAISAAQAGFMPIAGGTFTGPVILPGNATVNLNPVPLQQLNSMLSGYATTNFVNATFLPLLGGTMQGSINSTFSGNFGNSAIGGVTLQNNGINCNGQSVIAGITIGGGNGNITMGGEIQCANAIVSGNSNIGGVTFPGNGTLGATGAGSQIGGVVFSGGGNMQASFATFVQNVTIANGNSLVPGGDDQGFVGVPGSAWIACYAYAFNQQSDPRGKRDIELAPGALAEVMQIPVHTFRFPHDADDSPKHWGFLSTEVHDAMGGDFGGWLQGEDEAKSESLSLSDMVAVLWAAVRELAARMPA